VDFANKSEKSILQFAAQRVGVISVADQTNEQRTHVSVERIQAWAAK